MESSTEIQQRIQGLKLELDTTRSIHFARSNHWLGLWLMFLGLGASFAAGVCGFAGVKSQIVGIIGLVPGFVALTATTFKFQAKSSWYFRKADGLTALKSRLQFELPIEPSADDIAAISQELARFTKVMQREWDREFQFNWATLLGSKRE